MKSKLLQIIIVVITFTCSNFQTVKAKGDNKFTFNSISEIEFRNALKNNYNAKFVKESIDSIKLEKAFQSIDKTYNESEKELAENELCKSPRCLTTIEAFYPSLDIYLFYILDYHSEKACFVSASTNEIVSGNKRFCGSYGVMSKDGLWVGLERSDCDNFLQLEICKLSKNKVHSILKYDNRTMDINAEEEIPIFWTTKNTFYISTQKYDQENDTNLLEYYEIKLHE